MRDFGGPQKAHDRRLRAKLLFVLYETARSSPTGYLLGRRLADSVDSLVSDGFEDDAHALALMRDLVAMGFATERPRGFRKKGETFGVDHCEFSITSSGSELYLEERPPHVLIDDSRIPEGQ